MVITTCERSRVRPACTRSNTTEIDPRLHVCSHRVTRRPISCSTRRATAPVLAESAVTSGAESYRGIDVVQLRIDRGPTPRRVGMRPSIRAKTSAHVSFGPFSEIVHGVVDNRGVSAVGDGVASAQNARRPHVVALERRRGREKDQRVHERELVLASTKNNESFSTCQRRSRVRPARSIADGISAFCMNQRQTRPVRRFSALRSVMPRSMPITSGFTHPSVGWNASAKP
jgi:hypothetical protein